MLTFNCLMLTFNCLMLTFNCLVLTFNCLMLTFNCLMLTFLRHLLCIFLRHLIAQWFLYLSPHCITLDQISKSDCSFWFIFLCRFLHNNTEYVYPYLIAQCLHFSIIMLRGLNKQAYARTHTRKHENFEGTC